MKDPDHIIYFYNFKKKMVAVISRSSYNCMRSSDARMAMHGLGRRSKRKIYDRDMANEDERLHWATKARSVAHFYDSLEMLLDDERRIGVPEHEIEKISAACSEYLLRAAA